MADVNRGDRPLSPHLQIYRPQITSGVSIFHRLTGLGLAGAGVLIVWWFIAAAISPAYFAFVDRLLTSWFGDIIFTLALWAFFFHFLNGIRHFFWDAGHGFELTTANRSGWAVVIGSVILTVITIILY